MNAQISGINGCQKGIFPLVTNILEPVLRNTADKKQANYIPAVHDGTRLGLISLVCGDGLCRTKSPPSPPD